MLVVVITCARRGGMCSNSNMEFIRIQNFRFFLFKLKKRGPFYCTCVVVHVLRFEYIFFCFDLSFWVIIKISFFNYRIQIFFTRDSGVILRGTLVSRQETEVPIYVHVTTNSFYTEQVMSIHPADIKFNAYVFLC